MLTFQTDSDAAFGIGDDHDSVDLSLREDPSLVRARSTRDAVAAVMI